MPTIPMGAADTKASPFYAGAGTTASVGASGGGFDRSETIGADGSLLHLCEHPKTTDVKIVSDILLSFLYGSSFLFSCHLPTIHAG